MLRLYIFNTIIIVSCFSFVRGQSSSEKGNSSKKQVYVNLRYHNGVVIPHHESMSYLIEDYIRGCDLNIGRSNFGSDNWEKFFNYPEIGVGLYYTSLGNKSVYGEGWALYPYINFNIAQTSKFKASYKVAWGLGYVTNPYSEDNYTNMAIGSHFNAYIGLGLLLDYRISKHLSLTGGWSLHHFSNGGEKKPNKGMNLSTLNIGVKYHLNEDLYPSKGKYVILEDKRLELLTVIYGARSQGGLFYNTNTSFSGGITNTLLVHRNYKNAFGIGVDFRYYGGAPYDYEGNFMKMHYDFEDYLYSSAYLAFHKKMGVIAMYFHLGFYITSNIKPNQPVYPRVGVQYNINKKLVAHFGLKASFFAAEYIELGIGYRFHLKKNNE